MEAMGATGAPPKEAEAVLPLGMEPMGPTAATEREETHPLVVETVVTDRFRSFQLEMGVLVLCQVVQAVGV